MLKEAATIFEGFDEPDAELLIHGIIDGYVELPDRIILYDFKTDAVFGSEAQIEKAHAGSVLWTAKTVLPSVRTSFAETCD